MRIFLKARQQHWTAQGYTAPSEFGSATLVRRWPWSKWRVESVTGFCYELGDVFDWCQVRQDAQYTINRYGYKFLITTEPLSDEIAPSNQ